MKRHLKILGILFSVVLNLAFVGFAIYEWARQEHGRTPSQRELYHPQIWKQLGLRPDQAKQFASECRPFRQELARMGRRIRQEQIELLDVLANRPSDRAAIEATVRKIEELQHQMRVSVVEHLLHETRILTKEQRRRFFSLIKDRIRASRPAQPCWIPRSDPAEH